MDAFQRFGSIVPLEVALVWEGAATCFNLPTLNLRAFVP